MAKTKKKSKKIKSQKLNNSKETSIKEEPKSEELNNSKETSIKEEPKFKVKYSTISRYFKDFLNNLDLKHKLIITSLISILGSTILNCVILKFYSDNEQCCYTQESSVLDEKRLSSVGEYLKEKKVIDNDDIYTLDPQFDYRFDNIRDHIVDYYTVTSGSHERLQEIYLFETNDTDIVSSELEKLKVSLENKKTSATEKALSKAILKVNKNFVYLIISENAQQIEKQILNYLE